MQWPSFLPYLGAALGLLCLWGALHAARRKRLIDNLPTCKTTGVFIGLVELKGTAEAEGPLRSFLAECPCVYFSWAVEEHWSRTVTETYTDSKGQTHTRTRHESGWKRVANGGELMPFYLKDDCGVIRILPDGAKVEAVKVFEETCGRFDPLYYAKGPAFAVANSDHRRRFHESAVPLHAALYVMGQAREREDIVAPEIAADQQADMFLISTRTEEQISAGFGGAFWGWSIFGFVLSVAGFVGRDLAFEADPAQRWPLYLLPALGYLMASGLGWVWMVFNSLIGLRQRVRQAWSQVDVQLKRRHDLIPNLVRVVTGLRDYERTLQTELADLRAQQEATPPGVTGPDYHACGKTLRVVVERYPELKSQESFAQLQQSLTDTEQRIALARGYFNEIATHYNTRLQIIPDRFVANLTRLRAQALMTAEDFERAPVEVQLAE